LDEKKLKQEKKKQKKLEDKLNQYESAGIEKEVEKENQ